MSAAAQRAQALELLSLDEAAMMLAPADSRTAAQTPTPIAARISTVSPEHRLPSMAQRILQLIVECQPRPAVSAIGAAPGADVALSDWRFCDVLRRAADETPSDFVAASA